MNKTAIILCMLISFSSYSQLQFTKTKHQFGSINEEKGKVSTTFEYINTGSTPVIINKVQTSCGCTAPTYSQKPIIPNEKGIIEITFDPTRRPGNFMKTISVSTNFGDYNLQIEGNVIPKPLSIEDEYPIAVESVRFKTDHLPFIKVLENRIETQVLPLINNSDKEVSLEVINATTHLQITVPKTLKAREKAEVRVSYDAMKKKDWGFVIDKAQIKVNGKYTLDLTISANIVDDVKDYLNCAILDAEPMNSDIDYIVGQSVEKTIQLKNIGKSDLVIHKISVDDNFITFNNLKDKVLKPNECATLKLIISPSLNLPNKFYSKISIVTNDPTKWTTICRLILNRK